MGCGVSSSAKNVKEGNPPEAPIEHADKMKEKYELGRELGRGHFAKVRACTRKSDGVEFAIKIIDKSELKSSQAVVKEEIDILRKVGQHKHVVSLVDTFEDESEFYLIMEMCSGGDLFSKIVGDGKFSEVAAVRFCGQLASALKYIHSKGITHRDLKPENILLTSASLDADIKVADFGLSKLVRSSSHMMRTVCGTWAYCAPEVISRRPYSQEVDNWTLGVLMFILLSGYHPFDVYGELPEPQLLAKIQDCEYDFEDEVWESVSENAKDLIKGLLKLEPADRLSLTDYLQSPWIKGEGVADKARPEMVERLYKFNMGRTHFRALVLAKLASKKFKASIGLDLRKAQEEVAAAAAAAEAAGGGGGSPAAPDTKDIVKAKDNEPAPF